MREPPRPITVGSYSVPEEKPGECNKANVHKGIPVRTYSPVGWNPSVRLDKRHTDKLQFGRHINGRTFMATILYARVSTSEQTIEHQRTQAEEVLGIRLDRVLADEGVSGVLTNLKDRPQGKRLFDILRAGDTLVVRWVDRLGRNYSDVTESIRELLNRGVIIKTVINRMIFDGSTTDPTQMAVRDSLIAFMAATAQAQAEATKEAQMAGIAHAKEHGAFKGRKPSYTRQQLEQVIARLQAKASVQAIASATCLSRATIYRIQEAPDKAFTALEAWGL